MEDCYEAFEFAIKDSKKFGGDPKKFTLIGASAGGHLAVLVYFQYRILREKYFEGKGKGDVVVYATIAADGESLKPIDSANGSNAEDNIKEKTDSANTTSSFDYIMLNQKGGHVLDPEVYETDISFRFLLYYPAIGKFTVFVSLKVHNLLWLTCIYINISSNLRPSR